ncbi:lipid A-modifier LpxR family protein [Aquimarina algicola]|uniref:Lipid A deacylase LpxR family protein n=1 Tax=Aquimarina algicola TaxID=2589995 RepID=A0A504J4E0_9FLAO|nr:lipid A-modifier LpxR family protein [Aquimarina algicola]TPN83362.1 lipid A deacylase LpxR family protein [Aquimarina algicola]
MITTILNHNIIKIICLLFFISISNHVTGQESKDYYTHEISFGTDNDFFVWHTDTDRFYTYGVNANYRWKAKENSFFTKLFPKNKGVYHDIGINVEAYTPDVGDFDMQTPNRPFAGWSYFEYKLGYDFDNTSIKTGVDIGILGPHSYAGNLQNWFHREITGDATLNWDNQIGDIFGVNFRFEYARTLKRYSWFDISAVLNSSLGNIFIYAEPALLFRFGKFQNIGNSIALNNQILSAKKDTEFFIDASFRYKFSGYNATLEGDIFNDSLFSSEVINNLIFNAYGGVNFVKNHWVLQMRYYYANGEFDNGQNHRYVSVVAGYRF